MYCEKCGTKVDGNYCPECGKPTKNIDEAPISQRQATIGLIILVPIIILLIIFLYIMTLVLS